jgi:hypothetical protein
MDSKATTVESLLGQELGQSDPRISAYLTQRQIREFGLKARFAQSS